MLNRGALLADRLRRSYDRALNNLKWSVERACRQGTDPGSQAAVIREILKHPDAARCARLKLYCDAAELVALANLFHSFNNRPMAAACLWQAAWTREQARRSVP